MHESFVPRSEVSCARSVRSFRQIPYVERRKLGCVKRRDPAVSPRFGDEMPSLPACLVSVVSTISDLLSQVSRERDADPIPRLPIPTMCSSGRDGAGLSAANATKMVYLNTKLVCLAPHIAVLKSSNRRECYG